ncbi:ABC transporter ATP-binding protein [Brevibacillus reuszeri]|uniref:ABC transporter transmembrane domain-containing protein n=1 Tax=Brevibacillus reuszeri TaxID=54915 RepID=UPI002100DC0D|nr:ABC transporter ATP-binding protein [Brevibacillus reuszeri]MED1861567.1 ABC transporter ATP-binding protein [Brevibacillus reuszeri]
MIAALSILVISALEFIIPQWTKVVIDQVIVDQQFAALFELGALIIGAALLLGVFRFISSFVMTIVSQGAISQLRNKLYRRTVNLDLNFFDRNRTGDLMSRLTSDVNQLQDLVSADTLSIVADFFTFIAICAYLFYVDWQLALLLVSTFPFLFFTSRFFIGRIKSLYRTVRQSSAEISNHLQDSLSGIRGLNHLPARTMK